MKAIIGVERKSYYNFRIKPKTFNVILLVLNFNRSVTVNLVTWDRVDVQPINFQQWKLDAKTVIPLNSS
jgi:hypothetical protein